MIPTMTEAYEKAIKVINSCKNEVQLEGAFNYCNNFKTQFTILGGDEILINIYHKDLLSHLSNMIGETYRN